jgi:hypothetical protein
MPTLDADSLIIEDDITDIVKETILDAAINRITSHGYTIGNLSGTAGSKSKTVTQTELGWIQAVAVAIYAKEYKQGNVNVGGLSSSASGLSVKDPDELAENAVYELSKTDWSRAIV